MTDTICTPSVWQERVLQWFHVHGRQHLPWQHPVTSYRVWISEVMLQQTQVSTVIPYFNRFMESFPTVESLALATLDAVLAHWSGLGYYQRARNLHRAAQVIVSEFSNELPRTVLELTTLPGIGRSTAGAIVAIAFGQKAAILDGNVRRVLNRVHCIEDPKREIDHLWYLAEQYTPSLHTAAYTQAMMDLGATVCTRTRPDCDRCPVHMICGAHALGRELDYPARVVRATKPERSLGFLFLYHSEADVWLLEKRPNAGIWGGLWSAIEYPLDVDFSDWFKKQMGFNPPERHMLPVREHVFTHFRLWIHPSILRVSAEQASLLQSKTKRWDTIEAWQIVGLPSAIRKLLPVILSSSTENK